MGMQSLGTARGSSCQELRVCRFVAGADTGGKQGPHVLSYSSKLCFESIGASLLGSKQKKDKISLGLCPNLGGWGGGNCQLGAQGALMRFHSPVCPKNVPAREDLVIQEGLSCQAALHCPRSWTPHWNPTCTNT